MEHGMSRPHTPHSHGFHTNCHHQDVGEFQLATVSPTAVDNGKVTTWQAFYGKSTGSFDSGTLLPEGLYVRSDRTGRDTSKWKITGWLYNNVFYASIEEFKAAVAKPGFEKLGLGVDGPWAQLEKVGDALPFDELPPPVTIQPGPKRFSVDTNENFVSWSKIRPSPNNTNDNG